MTYLSPSFGVYFNFLLDLIGPSFTRCFGTGVARELNLSPSVLGHGEET